MISVKGYAAKNAQSLLEKFNFERRELKSTDIHIEILYCGVCHSDIHQVRNEWNNAIYPMVPGHEIVGKVINVGQTVSRFKKGDLAAVGCLVDSCGQCASCNEHLEQYCENGFVPTYNGTEKDGQSITYGGYSESIVVDESFTLKVPTHLKLEAVAPLLCAGITTFSPLKHWKVGPNKKVGIIGLGGLGHMALKFSSSLGAHTVLFTTSENKKEDAMRFGAKEIVLSNDSQGVSKHTNSFDLIINTVSADIDLNKYLDLLKREGSLVLLGVPGKPAAIDAGNLIFKRRNLTGSLIGGIAETQEMLDFCSKHNIVSDIELIRMDQINMAYERMLKNDVKYRFVIDMKSL